MTSLKDFKRWKLVFPLRCVEYNKKTGELILNFKPGISRDEIISLSSAYEILQCFGQKTKYTSLIYLNPIIDGSQVRMNARKLKLGKNTGLLMIQDGDCLRWEKIIVA